MQTRFYICRHCGNVIEKVHDAGVPVVCCGRATLIPRFLSPRKATGEVTS